MTLTAEQLQRATQAKSDQINAVDLLGAPLVCQILDVMPGGADQPVAIKVDAHPQPWKPSKTSLRVLCACWGNDPQVWIGRWVVLYCEESVKWAGVAVGGIRTSHLSHIDGRKTIMVNETRGKKKPEVVEPYYPKEGVQQQEQTSQQPKYWPDDAFEKQMANATPKLQSGEVTPEQVIEKLEKKAQLTSGQKARIGKAAIIETPDEDIVDAPPPYADDDHFAQE